MSSLTAPDIQVTHQQTRFHIADNDQTKEVDIRDLDIAIKQPAIAPVASTGAKKASRAARADTHEILAHAHLRIKTGIHYCFVGRNGAGKTTVAQAISRSLIPGLDPLNLRIASLEQRNDVQQLPGSTTVLGYVTHCDPYRREVRRKHDILAAASTSSEPTDMIIAYRKLMLERGRHELSMAEKEARLRSGAHGYNARAELRKHEARVDDLTAAVHNMDLSTNTEQEALEATQLMADLQIQLDTMPVRDLEVKANRILRGLGFTDTMLHQSFEKLSGGWQMRCLLAAALVQPADLLILDEPTNHLDMLGILWLQRYLVELKEEAPDCSVMLISHDRQFVNETCQELVLLKDKQLVYYPGNLDSYDKSIHRERLRLTRMKEAQDKQISHIKSSIADSMRQGKKHGDDGKLKQAKSRQKKLDDRMGMEVSAKGTRFKLNRDLGGYYLKSRADIEIPHEEAGVSMSFPPPTAIHPSGSLVSLENVSLKYKSAAKPVFTGVHLVVHPGDRIGVLGLNGAGKSTLVKILTSTIPPSSGTLQTHPRLKLGYYSQLSVDQLSKQGAADPQLTSLALLTSRVKNCGQSTEEQPLRALLSALGLQGRTASDTPIDKLSGGQLVRLALALILIDPPHLLVLDEPTTHLDVYTVTALAQALAEYDGAVILVTHDRFFMRAVVEGESLMTYDSDDEEQDEETEEVSRRRQVYVAGGGELTICNGGVDAWETSLEKKLTKLI